MPILFLETSLFHTCAIFEMILKRYLLGWQPTRPGLPTTVCFKIKSVPADRLGSFFRQIWETKTISQECIDASITYTYKTKDNWYDCNNYRSLSLLSIAQSFRTATFLVVQPVGIDPSCFLSLYGGPGMSPPEILFKLLYGGFWSIFLASWLLILYITLLKFQLNISVFLIFFHCQ